MNPTSSSIDPNRGKNLPWLIAAFFASFVLLLMGFGWLAFANKPSEVTENAYQKGLQYNQVLTKETQQRDEGWKTKIVLDDSYLRFRLRDAENTEASGAKVEAWLVRPSSQSMDQRFAMQEIGSGIYEARVNFPAKGLWEVHVTADYKGSQIQASQNFTVP